MLGPCNAIKKIRGLQTSTVITKDVKTTHWIKVTMKGWTEERKAKRRGKKKKCYMKLQEPMNYLPKFLHGQIEGVQDNFSIIKLKFWIRHNLKMDLL
jgi:hypothetical protein